MLRRRHILQIAPPWYPVPPHGYGGIESVVSLLARELRSLGHRVSMVSEATVRRGEERADADRWAEDLGTRRERLRELTYAARVAALLDTVEDADVIHDHTGFATLLTVARNGRFPVLHTVHGLVREPEMTFLSELSGVGLVSISDSQRARCQALAWEATVHNAVDVDALPPSTAGDKEGYLLCLARICSDKGQDIAIEVARRCGRRLVLGGKIEETAVSQAFFDEVIAPAVDGDLVRYIPNVAGEEKSRLLRGASALLAPIRWSEPFGLSVVEAMVSGTPAISFARGAAPELIEEGVTGFLAEDTDGMVDAVNALTSIDPASCARASRSRFAPRRMAEEYTRVYERVIARGSGGDTASRAQAWVAASAQA